ncbi:hypothetical protein [Roseateles sp.]|uniref:hypothetical protein n=1 Tax=Roseateles sp. TaxID=1971397 RepID=UPI0031D6626E
MKQKLLSGRNCKMVFRATFLAFTLLQGPVAVAETVGKLGEYEVRFAPWRAKGERMSGDFVPRAVIQVTRGRTGGRDEILKELSPLEPGCGEVPALASLADRYVVLCGHLGGRHFTYRVFRLGAGGLESTALDAFDQASPLVIDAQDRITTLVTRRDQFPSELKGPLYFPFVYALHADESGMGFAPAFDEAARPQYLQFYEWTKANKNLSQFLPVMLAALVASRDQKAICREIKEWGTGEQQKRGRTVPVDRVIDDWAKRLPSIGYPHFDFNSCRVD